jgi:hypothetical protein
LVESGLNENEMAGMLDSEEMSRRAVEALKGIEKMTNGELREALLERLKLSSRGVKPLG